MIGYPYDYGDGLSCQSAEMNRNAFVRTYGIAFIAMVVYASASYAIEPGSPVPGPGNSGGINPNAGSTPGAAPTLSANAAANYAKAKQPVLAANLPPAGVVSGKGSLGCGVVSLAWTSMMAVSTGNPALYIASAGMFIYFLGGGR